MSTWPQRESPESTQAQLGTRYECPLDGTPLSDCDDHWWCEHTSEAGGKHETVLAFDTDKERMVRYKGTAIVPVSK